MIAAAARDSHRSPSDRQLLSPDRDMMMTTTPIAQAGGEEEDEEASTVETITGDVADVDVPSIGVAALEADVGSIDSLLVHVTPQTAAGGGGGGGYRNNKKKPSKTGGNSNTAPQGGPLKTAKGKRGVVARSTSASKGVKSPGIAAAAAAATGGDGECAGGAGVGNGGDEAREEVIGVEDGLADEKPKRLSTERSQHMYETHRQTQVTMDEGFLCCRVNEWRGYTFPLE